MREWEKYRISVPGDMVGPSEGWKFTSVSHIAHLKESRRVLEDGFLRAGLVNDGSKLDTTRTCVNFFSANTWGPGSIYGNVSWSYNWEWLVGGKNIYWVEDKTDRKFPVYRFLISSRKPSEVPELDHYHPVIDKGPLRKVGDDWFFNGGIYVSEFLFDEDYRLRDCENFGFVKHRDDWCVKGGNHCVDRHMDHQRAAGQTLAFILANGVRTVDHNLISANSWRKNVTTGDVVDSAVGSLIVRIGGKYRPSGTVCDPASSRRIMTGALSLIGMGNSDDGLMLTEELRDMDAARQALRDIIRDHFNEPSWEIDE